MKPTSLALPALLLTLPLSALAQDAALAQCRQIKDPAVRLECYDTWATAKLGAQPAAPAPASATASATASAPATRPAAVPSVDAEFGLARPVDMLQAVVTRIDGFFGGWNPGERIRLANGQVWQVTDDSRTVYELRDPKVTIRRASMGRYVLDIEGARVLPTVRRVE